MSKNQHLVPHDKGWAVRGARNRRATSLHRTQRKPIDAARIIARIRGGELVIHSRTGRIRRRDTTSGNDPMPPRG